MPASPSAPRRPSRLFAAAGLIVSAVLVVPTAAQAAPPPHTVPTLASDASGWQQKPPRLATPWTKDVTATNALPQYPRPQLVRKQWKSLNGVWEFAGASADETPPFNERLSERILVPYPTESSLSGVQRHEDYMWYRRTVVVPASWKINSGQRLRLNFGAVDYRARVWVNGRLVATHTGGYTAFSADVTDALTRSGPQEILVGVEDRGDQTWQPLGKQRNAPDAGIFYTGSSGIWQSVWMEPVGSGYVTRLMMTPKIKTKTLQLRARTAGRDVGLKVTAVVMAGKKKISTTTGAATTTLHVKVPKAHLWSPTDPYLYRLRVTLKDRKKIVDSVGSYFGMREIGTKKGRDGKLRITLNGKITFLMSTLDQGFWPDGIYTAPTDQALRFDIARTKDLGFNTIRKHIKVEPDRWYYWADRLGMLVWQDMPAMKTSSDTPPVDAQQEFQRQLHTIVDQHRSWTSIIGWIPFNEGWGEWSKTATGEIAQAVHRQDPSRLVDAHSGVNCCASHGDSGAGNVIDYHTYTGPASPSPDATRVAVDGEHGGFGLEVPGHMWYSNGGAYEMEPNSTVLTDKYVANQRQLIPIARQCAISGAVYTQTTDVEHEVNGFYTYDRAVQKMDFLRVREVNRAVIRSNTGTTLPVDTSGSGTPGLQGVHAYAFDEGSGTTATDAVGNANATLSPGVSWVPGVKGTALSFNADGQQADTNRSLVATDGSYSVAAWVKLNEAGTAFQTVVSQDTGAASAFFLQYSGADQRFAFSFVDQRALAAEKPEPGRWYHLTGVRDAKAGTIALYVDGKKQATKQACLASPSTGHTLIGRGQFGGNQVDWLRGTVDDVRIYDRALTAAEVAELAASTKP